MANKRLQNVWNRLVPVLASISVEPVFLLDGFAFSNMVVLVESLQFDKICKVNLNYTEEICSNFDAHPEEEHAYNVYVSSFKRNDGIISSVIPLFFILFIGAWSDKYGRKVPLCLTLFCHILFSGGYLFNSWYFSLPVEFLLGVGFLDSIGGGAVAFLTVSNAYISDVTTTEQRTSRVALANSLWFLGGPLGTLIGTEIYKLAGYTSVFCTSLVLYIIAFAYVAILLPESHGPFSDKERLRKISTPKPTMRLRDTIIRVYGLSKRPKNKLGKTESEEEREYKKNLTYRKMFLDFFDIRRVLMSFKCVFKKRDGFTRLFIFMLILSNFIRKIGRGAYMFYFTKEVLLWNAISYGYWVTYKNFISTMGSLLAVPILSSRLKVSDNTLGMIGSVSSIMDYFLYGLVTPSTFFLMWLAPATSLLVNSCSIAMRAMMSKYVSSDELGQVSAVTGTIEGIVPIISTTVYSAITRSTFDTFPGAQYFFGSSCNILMALIFVLILVLDKSDDYDLESAKPQLSVGPVKERALVIRKDSRWLFDEQNKNKIRLSTILLTALNFSIEVPSIERVYSNKDKKKLSIIGEGVEIDENGVSAPNERVPEDENGITGAEITEVKFRFSDQNGVKFTEINGNDKISIKHEDETDNKTRTDDKNSNIKNLLSKDDQNGNIKILSPKDDESNKAVTISKDNDNNDNLSLKDNDNNDNLSLKDNGNNDDLSLNNDVNNESTVGITIAEINSPRENNDNDNNSYYNEGFHDEKP